jgi:hypothetical protein
MDVALLAMHSKQSAQYQSKLGSFSRSTHGRWKDRQFLAQQQTVGSPLTAKKKILELGSAKPNLCKRLMNCKKYNINYNYLKK